MARKNKSISTDSVLAPQTREEAELLLSQIGSLQRENQKSAADMDDELAAVKERYTKRMDEVKELIVDCFSRLYVWAEANRSKLLQGKAKTALISSGSIAWRNAPKAVQVKDTKRVLEQLKEKGLERFIRTVEEIDKVAILKEPKAVDGIVGLKITSKELFAAQPFETQIEQVASVDKL